MSAPLLSTDRGYPGVDLFIFPSPLACLPTHGGVFVVQVGRTSCEGGSKPHREGTAQEETFLPRYVPRG